MALALAGLHGKPANGGQGAALPPAGPGPGSGWTVLDALVGTVLSQCTSDPVSHRMFGALKGRYPAWEALMRAEPSEVARTIRAGGQSAVKTGFLQALLRQVHAERGACSLEYLRDLPTEAAKAELLRFKGVGPKTAACVLVYALARPDFPVDVHVWKLARALGWVPGRCTREQAYRRLNARVPDELKYALHVLLQEHGKAHGHGAALLRRRLAARARVAEAEAEGGAEAAYRALPAGPDRGRHVQHVRR